MKMRRQHCARLKHAKGQIFTCGMFGTCSDSVLSPRTPPALVISSPIPANAIAPAPPQQSSNTSSNTVSKHSQNNNQQQQQQQQRQQQSQQQQQQQQQQIQQQQKKDQEPQQQQPPPPLKDQQDQQIAIPSPDKERKEMLLQQAAEQPQQQQQDAKPPIQLVQQQIQAQQQQLQQQQQQDEGERIKKRYVGLVDRDLSPFQQQLLKPALTTAAAPPGAAPPRESPPSSAELLPTVDLGDVEAVCREVVAGRALTKPLLRSLRLHAEETAAGKSAVVASGVAATLASLLCARQPASLRGEALLREAFGVLSAVAEETAVQRLLPPLMPLLTRELRRRNADAWVMICKAATSEELTMPPPAEEVVAPGIPGIPAENAVEMVLPELVGLLQDMCAEAKLVRLALKALLGLCLSKRNRAAAVAAGGVEALLTVLVDLHGADGGDFCARNGIVVNVERALAALELLCTTPAGRAAVAGEPGFVPELVGLVLGVSERATEYAAGVLCAVLCDDAAVAAAAAAMAARPAASIGGGGGGWDSVQEMAVKGGAPAQMLLVMQSECSERARRKAAKLLKALHKYGEDHSTMHSDLASTITY